MRILDEVSSLGTLTPEEVKALIENYRNNNDKKALEKLVKHNLKFVSRLATKYAPKDRTLREDLLQAGSIGILKAAKMFNPDLGFTFLSFALWYIKREIFLELKSANLIHVPVNVMSEYYKLERELQNTDDFDLEISNANKKVKAAYFATRMSSLNIPRANPDSGSLLDILIDPSDENGDRDTFKKIIKQELHEELKRVLSERELFILKCRFEKDMPMREIGQRIGVTRQRVDQILNATFKKLKNNKLINELYT